MFEICMGNTVVGSAEISQQGLYYHIKCICRLPNNQIHRIVMRSGNLEKDLGICVPEGEVFTLSKRVPTKDFQGNDFIFVLINEANEEYVISDKVPFAHLDKLESARLRHSNGQMKIVIDSAPVLPDSDQTQEYPNR